ncbi:MAG: hypothetical protein JWQ11_1280, partial [Rhizobacter sp.]|nr:hypothetical protein [Rhizobacter sp.]
VAHIGSTPAPIKPLVKAASYGAVNKDGSTSHTFKGWRRCERSDTFAAAVKAARWLEVTTFAHE